MCIKQGNAIDAVQFGDGFTPVAVSCGGYFTCVLSVEKIIKCFGRNNHAMLGVGHTTSKGTSSSDMGMYMSCPFFLQNTYKYHYTSAAFTGNALQSVNLGDGFVPLQLAAGREHVCVLSMSYEIKVCQFHALFV